MKLSLEFQILIFVFAYQDLKMTLIFYKRSSEKLQYESLLHVPIFLELWRFNTVPDLKHQKSDTFLYLLSNINTIIIITYYMIVYIIYLR